MTSQLYVNKINNLDEKQSLWETFFFKYKMTKEEEG